MEVNVYTVEGGGASDAFYTMVADEALDYAKSVRGRVIRNEYEFSDSTLVDTWDFRTSDDPSRADDQ